MKYALDTNIITYYLKGNKKILDKVDQEAESDNIIIPPFAYFEIKKWLMAVNSKTKLQAFEKLFEKYGIDAIENGITVDDGDLLIAAYCIQNNYILVSNNQKHFEKIENIQVVNWTA